MRALYVAFIICKCMHATYVSSDFARCKIWENFAGRIMTEQVPCFQLGFDFLNVENSDD